MDHPYGKYLTQLFTKVLDRIFSDPQAKIRFEEFSGAKNELTSFRIDCAAGNHCFDDFPESFGISKQEGQEIRSFMQAMGEEHKQWVQKLIDQRTKS